LYVQSENCGFKLPGDLDGARRDPGSGGSGDELLKLDMWTTCGTIPCIRKVAELEKAQ